MKHPTKLKRSLSKGDFLKFTIIVIYINRTKRAFSYSTTLIYYQYVIKYYHEFLIAFQDNMKPTNSLVHEKSTKPCQLILIIDLKTDNYCL